MGDDTRTSVINDEFHNSVNSEEEAKIAVESTCDEDNLGHYLSDNIHVDSKVNIYDYYRKEDGKTCDVCLVCGDISKNLNLFYNLENNNDITSSANINLLSRIVCKPKREIFIVSFRMCGRCSNLIQEVSDIEENLRVKKQTIKEMFESTLHSYKEKTKAASSTSCSSTQSFDTDNNTSAHSSQTKVKSSTSVVGRPPNQAIPGTRTSSRRQSSFKEYYCSSCEESFHSLALWIQHCSKHGDNEDSNFKASVKSSGNRKKRKRFGVHKCEDCNKIFHSKHALREHTLAHQKGRECNICGRYLSTKARLKAHLFKMHEIGEEKNKEIQCEDCKKSFSTKAGLRYHRNVIHHVGTKHVCEHCSKVFYYHVPYRSHLLYAHGEKKVICETCGEKFYTVAKLNIHVNAVHRSAKSWSCKECKSQFTTDTAYRHHVNMKHLKIQHNCNYCGSNFRKKSSLLTHLLKHSVFVCQLCKENFSRTDDLKAHMLEVHGKEITLKGKRKQISQDAQKKLEETVIQQKPDSQEVVQQNEHVTSIVINDLLIAAESYNNDGLQPFRLSDCEKLPDKQDYSSGGELKVEPMGIIDSSSDLQSVDAVQFDTVESLQIKASPDQIEMGPGVSLINVQILGDMEMSQSDTLDLKNSMLTDTGEHIPHDGQLDNEDNITSQLTVETHHLTTTDLSVGNGLGSSSHPLGRTDHLEAPCHLEVTGTLDTTTHLEVTHQLDASHQLQVETADHLEVTGHFESENHISTSDDIENVNSIDSGVRESNSACLANSDSLKAAEPKDHLAIVPHVSSSLDETTHLETEDHCSLPSMISQIDNQVPEEIVQHISPHMHDIASDVGNEISTHIGSDIHDITSEVTSQIVDPVNEDMATQMQTQMDSISANDVGEVDEDMVAHIDQGISSIESEVRTQIVSHVEPHIGDNIDPHIVQEDSDMVDQSLDKQLEKMDSVEFPVTLNQKDVQYPYVMYISASTEDSNQE